MHEQNVAHRYAWSPTDGKYLLRRDLFRDCTVNNVMFDPSEMYPQGFHPVQNRRKWIGVEHVHQLSHTRLLSYYVLLVVIYLRHSTLVHCTAAAPNAHQTEHRDKLLHDHCHAAIRNIPVYLITGPQSGIHHALFLTCLSLVTETP
jgi:hypothetical protein